MNFEFVIQHILKLYIQPTSLRLRFWKIFSPDYINVKVHPSHGDPILQSGIMFRIGLTLHYLMIIASFSLVTFLRGRYLKISRYLFLCIDALHCGSTLPQDSWFWTNLNLHYLWMLSHKISGYWFLRRELWYIAIKLPPFRFIHSPCDGNFNKLESTLPENSTSSISIPGKLNFEKTILIILKLLPKESQFWTNVWNDEQEI